MDLRSGIPFNGQRAHLAEALHAPQPPEVDAQHNVMG
jgi:hypothetical protein